METLVAAIQTRLNGDETIFGGLDWRTPLNLRSGLSNEEDWNFRWELTVLLAEVLMKRFEQRLNS